MNLPPVHARGGVLYADMRHWHGPRHLCLRLPAGSPDIEVGLALGRALESMRAAGLVSTPELPGIEARRPGELFRDAISQYKVLRSYAGTSKAGVKYVKEMCDRIGRDLGHVELANFEGLAGDAVVCAWQEQLWSRELGDHTCKNYLAQLFAILTWCREKHMLRDLPTNPGGVRPGGVVYRPIYEHWTEEDFRRLREHWADHLISKNKWAHFMPDRAYWPIYVALRRLYLSWGYYTGMHPADLNRIPGWWASWEVGRYRRENSKSARCVRPAVFDMPEQLRLDCEEEVRRLGRPFRDDELICGGAWPEATENLRGAVKSLWPDERTRPAPFTFRLARRSTAWEYCVRGWSAEQIAEILGHVDRTMVDEVYRRCDQLGLISDRRLPWIVGSAPRGAPRTSSAKVLQFRSGG